MSKDKEPDQPREERRAENDRRNLNKSVSFPYKTKEGLVILKDRRKTPDRRISNICVEDSDIDEKEFFEFLKNHNKYM